MRGIRRREISVSEVLGLHAGYTRWLFRLIYGGISRLVVLYTLIEFG